MSARTKVVILGGSALATPLLFEALGEQKASAPYDFVLYGRNSEHLALVKQISEDILTRFAACDIRISATTEAEKALKGTEYCINQVRAGGLESRAFDESFPRQFGIPGEETTGPGGFSDALRSIPVALEFARIIEKVAPHAIIINLANPSSLVQYAIRRHTKLMVIGTCDAPVTLMETIARLLNVTMSEVTFDLAGMHHFTWIVGISAGGKDHLPEVIERAAELPKNYVDPEVIKAFGAVPSPYFRYYFHPNRVLAATEGHIVRARELMELSERMLADYRKWAPGKPPATLYERGAVWYSKIVAPTLLALAEKRTTELVLSVDNNGLFSWLPEDAIIEVPVPIVAGQMMTPRKADLPADIRALIMRNCAYEMQATEAIVTDNRPLALRALMSNLMVSRYEQAKGVLDLLWPVESIT